ncbi:PTS sugar transporter subunit IIA [Jeotgalibaca caeni]|uniref:PTS sugar transporter subunit IIA n=1 Tax=Jeotgalibaca caeni TaxID=3028623 RepID=UPI00237E9988|nr:PTS sugar transporter subunit IIA [Jeotgalibaca caeni]MDE1548217.1 PTS sugar transporter subunit IIA [Jeotgalibaca caeni]
MIGCLITGHGEFAPGLTKALHMIAGTQEHFQVIAFQDGDSLEAYEENIRLTLDALLAETEGVLVFTDLLGGTPFRTAMTQAVNYENVEVITGTNLPMLIESSMMRLMETDVKALAERSVAVGIEGVQHVVLDLSNEPDELDEDAEGI